MDRRSTRRLLTPRVKPDILVLQNALFVACKGSKKSRYISPHCIHTSCAEMKLLVVVDGISFKVRILIEDKFDSRGGGWGGPWEDLMGGSWHYGYLPVVLR